MKILILGASGATGKLVVQQLLKRNIKVRLVVRETAVLPFSTSDSMDIEIVKGNINDFNIEKITELVKDCDSVICCLGHNLSLKGILGPPHKLVFNTVKKITGAIESLNLNQKFILMSTTGYTNKKTGEKDTRGEKIVLSLLKFLLPPHRDNMLAADYLVYKLGSNTNVEWAAIRPDTLFDEETASMYEIFENKIRNSIFNPGKTSRVNVSNFMAELAVNNNLWQEWKFKTPVIYNKELET